MRAREKWGGEGRIGRWRYCTREAEMSCAPIASQYWAQPGTEARLNNFGLVILGKWHWLLDLITMPLKLKRGGHRALAQSLAHSQQSQKWMVFTQTGNECQLYPGDAAKTKAASRIQQIKDLKCAANVQMETFRALPAWISGCSISAACKSTYFLHSKRLTTTHSYAHDNYTTFELDLWQLLLI